MSKYHLVSDYQPTGDQPEAIRQLTEGLERGDKAQVLLGVTGSGKTFTMANVIANWNRPTLILTGTPVVYGDEGVLSRERRRVLCQLL